MLAPYPDPRLDAHTLDVCAEEDGYLGRGK
jgi:hypothetical protein